MQPVYMMFIAFAQIILIRIYTDYDRSIYNFYAYAYTGGKVDETDYAKLLSGMNLHGKNLSEFLLLPSTQLEYYLTFSNESEHFHVKFAFDLQYGHGYVVKAPRILTSIGLKSLPEDFGKVSSDNASDYDNDGLANNFEIDWDNPLISNGELPTLGTCIHAANSSGKLTYLENGLERLRRLPCNAYFELLKAEILPLNSSPLSKDSDGDSLLDGSVRKNIKGKIIAPIDPNPLKYDGPKGIWQEHIKLADETVPSDLQKWYGYAQNGINIETFETISNSLKTNITGLIKTNATVAAAIAGLDLEKASYILDVMDWRNYVDLNEANSGIEGFETLIGEIIALVMTGDIGINHAEELIALVQAHRLNVLLNNNEATIQDVTAFMTYLGQAAFSDGARASLGSRFLNFKADSENVIHSQPRQWQAIGGYNNGYDALFRTFTGENMDRVKFPFKIGNMEYIFWAWRGDYLNLGAGAEVGIYSRPNWLTQDPDGLDHYFTDYNLALPMTLSLYNYGDEVESIFQWYPTDKQWWITGFNPSHLRDEVDVHKQAMICRIDLSQNVDIYNALFLTSKPKFEDYNDDTEEFCVFDYDEKIVWIVWY